MRFSGRKISKINEIFPLENTLISVHKQPDPPRLRNWKCRQVYHVYQRGSRRQNTFLNPADSVLYLDKLDVFARRYKVRIHCFCLMSNHVHFMLEPLRKGAISKLMQHLQSQYARHVHRRLNTQGHLWHHHFHAKLIRSETQYRETLLYIERNPTAAKLEKKAHLYDFSSAKAHTANQPLLTVTHKKFKATIKLYLVRWQKAFADKDELINWPAWLDSNRQPTRHKDYASLLGKHLPFPNKMVPLQAQTQSQTARAG